MIRKVQTYIETHHLLTFDKPVIIGFSGGGDSVSLLYMLHRSGYTCIAAHCNFHLRSTESDRDEAFCRLFAEKYNIPFEKVDFNTQPYATQKQISIEMAARELRYEWFETIRTTYGAQAIAVAHHKDDSIETMLLNMMRGTGIRGLCGIRPKNGAIIRPLLCVSRKEIIQYLEEQHIEYVTDSSNLSDEYTRNFIRLRLLPLMEQINPSVRQALSRTSENLADAASIYLQTIRQAKVLLTEMQDNGRIHVSIKKLMQQQAPQTILYEVLKDYGFSRSVSKDIFHALTGEAGKLFNAANSTYKLLKDRDKLIIFKPDNQLTEKYQLNETTDWQNLPISLSAKIIPVDDSFKIEKSPFTATFDYDKIKFPFILRKWQPGDWFIPFGMKGRQKLSDFFSNQKMSLPEKKEIWLLCSNQYIIWIIGKRTDDRFRINHQTKKALVINFSPKTCNY